jgi:hypothetical protein
LFEEKVVFNFKQGCRQMLGIAWQPRNITIPHNILGRKYRKAIATITNAPAAG